MLDRFLLRDAVDRIELLVGHIGAVRLESIQLRNVAAQEDLQRLHVHEARRVGNDAGKETLILLIALQLGLAVGVAGDDDGLKALDLPQHIHVGIETELPFAVLHRGGDDDLEGEIHLPVPFRDVAEAGRHPGRLQAFRSHHFTGGIIPDRLHQYHLATEVILDAEGVTHRPDLLDLRKIGIIREDQGGCRIATLDGSELPLRRAGNAQRKEGRQGSYENYFCFHLEYVDKAE